MVKAGLTVGNVTWNMWLVAPVFGFVGAGLAHAMHELSWGASAQIEKSPETSRQAVLDFGSVYSAGWSLVLLFIGGPLLVLSHGRDYWRRNLLPASGMVLCLFIAFLWSFFLGILIMQGLWLARILG